MLLFVFAHAVVAGATHFHRVSRPGDEPARSVRQDGADDGPTSKGHIQCVLCRLQRQFVSDHRPAAPKVVAPASGVPSRHEQLSAETPNAHPLIKKGRAPPLS